MVPRARRGGSAGRGRVVRPRCAFGARSHIIDGMAPSDRTPACVAVVAIGCGLAVVAVVRPLGLIHPFGATLLVELLRAPILGGGAALTAMLLLRKRDIDANVWRTRHDPGMGRSALSAWLAGALAGGIALSVGAIPDPTDSYDAVPWMFFGLGIVGAGIGNVLGPLFGVVYAAFASRALRRSAAGSGDMLDGALGATARLTGIAAAIGALVHAWAGELDPFGVALLLGSLAVAIALAVRAHRRAAWIARVVKGEVAGWSVAPVASLVELPEWIDGGGDSGVLVTGIAQQGTFRTMPAEATPVALVDVTGEEAIARLGGARVRAFVGAALVLVVLGATVGLAWFRDATPPTWGSTPMPLARGRAFRDLQGEGNAICARRSDGRLVCWGSGAGALFGKPRPALRTPEAHPTLGPVRTFALGRHQGQACAVLEAGDHRPVCWSKRLPEPTPIGPPDVTAIAIGGSFTVAVTADGSVWRWGDDLSAQAKQTGVERVDGLPPIADIAAGSTHVVARGRDGSAWCWGRSSAAECGGHVGDKPRRLEGGPFEAIAAGYTTYLFTADGMVVVHGTTFGYGAQELLRDKQEIRQVAQSKSETCVRQRDGRVACTRADKARPNVVLQRDVREIAGSDDGFCAITQRALWCWNGFSLPFMQ